MNQTTKNVLGGAIVLAVLAVGYAALSFVHSYGESIQPSSFRSFSVSGQGKAIAIPDVAEFTFTIITQGGKDIASLQSQNTTAANKAIAFVKSGGVADKDIQTQYYNVSPDYQTYNCNIIPQVYNGASSGSAGSMIGASPVRPCPPASIVGYTITQSVDVKIRDFTKIGDIMGGVVTNGANQVGQLSFTLDDPAMVQNQAEADAITKAKAEAKVVAQAGGFTIGRLLSVQTGGSPYPIYNYASGAGIMESVKSVAVPAPAIQPGSEEVDMTVTLQYEIQ
jgi:uncharacterized protein YggE